MLLEFLIPQIRENNPPILTLDLNGGKIGDDGLHVLSAELRTNKTITTIDLSYNDFGPDGIKDFIGALQTNQTLTNINLSHNKIGPKGAKYLRDALKTNTSLRVLNLANSAIYLALESRGIQYLCELIKTNQHLESLDLSYNQIESIHTKDLSEALKANCGLSTFIIKGNPIGSIGIQHICEALKTNNTLSVLNLATTQMVDSDSEFVSEMLTVNPSLTELNLGFNQIGSNGTQKLSEALKRNTVLTKFFLGSNPIGPIGARYLSEALRSNTTLTVLDLGVADLGDTGVKHIFEALRVNKTLTSIRLVYNEISDVGVNYVCDALKVNKTLKTIDLSYNNISNAGISSLSEVLKVNNTLTTIHLGLNKKISPVGIKVLRETLKTNYTLLEVSGVDDPVIKKYLERNAAIAASFDAFTKDLSEGLKPEEIKNKLTLVKGLIESHTEPTNPICEDHYLCECYRLLTALGLLATPDANINTLVNLLTSFAHPSLQKLADLALGLLNTNIASQLDKFNLNDQSKRCRLLLYGLKDELQRSVLNNIAYIALFQVVYPQKPFVLSEFNSFKSTTVLLNQSMLKKMIHKALIACQRSQENQELEINFLKTILVQNNYSPTVVARLGQSPAFLAALRNQYPEATHFTLIEHVVLADDNLSFLIPVNELAPTITQQTYDELNACIQNASTFHSNLLTAQAKKLRQLLSDTLAEAPMKHPTPFNLSFFAEKNSQKKKNLSLNLNSATLNSSLSKEQLLQIKQLINSLEKEIDCCWYPNKKIKQIKVDALSSLIFKARTMDITKAVSEIELEYPEVRHGLISTRTADLLDGLRRVIKHPQGELLKTDEVSRPH
ncbi:hypothetical protein [Legionella tucsonensis]|uniref:Gala protein type 1, 3 or 4 n=1 Tax=Legionella tucsonensis TaxID=40335 RepID=A0A0W0ZUW8_9GAMM|nr:hypothetical protein [Legionella tucsonensis]KTD72965.1 Gala protein type 1, 3 or 4 [Legionella tucsonensis]